MKDWLATTLFPRLGVFCWRLPLALGVITLTTAGVAGATDFSAQTCGNNAPVFGSPTPVALIGSGDGISGGVFAGSPVNVAAQTSARAPNVPASDSRDCSSAGTANYTDVVVQGPAPTVVARLHIPFHANITQDFTEMSDGSNTIFSADSANLGFNAEIFGPGAFARAGLEVRFNRQASIVELIPFINVNAEFVPQPRIPGLIPLDSDGFITRFFQISLPVTGGVGSPFAGFATTTIDELRGEIILTTAVPTNVPLTIHLNLNVRSTSVANFLAGAFGAIGEARIGVPTDGAVVFELPDGFTADVPSAGVVNNVVPQIFRCTRTATDWRSHPEAWPVNVMTLGSKSYNQTELLNILQRVASTIRPDASLGLAQQLIAARLNEANGAAPGPMLPPSMAADALLAQFPGKAPYGVLPIGAIGQQMTNVGLQLSRYNTGQLTPVCVP